MLINHQHYREKYLPLNNFTENKHIYYKNNYNMKNLFNEIPKSEKQRILEMHKNKGYSTINEENLTPNQIKAQNAGYGPVSKEYADELAITTKNFTILKGKDLKPVEIFGEKGYEVKGAAITRSGKIIPKKGLGSQFCYAIPADSISAFNERKNITQTEINDAKKQGVSPWTDIEQFFRSNDMGPCRANNEKELSDPIGKYLYIGSNGPFVKTVQLKLANAAEGYANEFMMLVGSNKLKDPFDGKFGKTTLSVVKEYQKDNNISPADGRVRKDTWEKLKNVASTHQYDVAQQKWVPTAGEVEKIQSKPFQV
jgi:hypothetical protein